MSICDRITSNRYTLTHHFHCAFLSKDMRALEKTILFYLFFCFSKNHPPLLPRTFCAAQYEMVIERIRSGLRGDAGDLTRNVKTLTFRPNGPDFVTIRDIMRVCERAYVRVGSRLAPGIRVSLHPLDQYSVQWRSTVSFSRNDIAISFVSENAFLRLLRTTVTTT